MKGFKHILYDGNCLVVERNTPVLNGSRTIEVCWNASNNMLPIPLSTNLVPIPKLNKGSNIILNRRSIYCVQGDLVCLIPFNEESIAGKLVEEGLLISCQ
jgi:hypothetical protein